MVTRSNHRATAILLFAQVAILIGGYFVLQAAFDFPDILRESAADRLTLFASKESVIVPTYWVYAMTGLLQVALSVMLWRVSRVRDTALGQLAVVFGILTGVFQVMGFIRWVVVIPVLATALRAGTSIESITLAVVLRSAGRPDLRAPCSGPSPRHPACSRSHSTKEHQPCSKNFT